MYLMATIQIDMTEKESVQSRRLPDQTTDFVLVTALAEERDAVLDRFPGYRKLPPAKDDIRTYYYADLPITFPDNSTGTYRIIIMCLLGMGRVQAVVATADAIRRWHPRYILLVGIAGGMASKNVRLGDILISDQIVDYELQKLTSHGFEVRWEVQRADPRLLDVCNSFRDESWQELIKISRPDPGRPNRFTGPIASGDKKIAFTKILARYRSMWPKLIGVEMEAAGAATAAFQSADRPGFFMVRGVSDLADENIGSPDVEKWRSYACDVAASFTIALLKSGPVPLSEDIIQVKTKQAELILEGPFNEFTFKQQQDIVSVLSALLKIDPSDIRVLKVYQGSIVIIIEMPETAANHLYEMATKHDFRIMSLGIKSVLVEGREIIELADKTAGYPGNRPEQLYRLASFGQIPRQRWMIYFLSGLGALILMAAIASWVLYPDWRSDPAKFLAALIVAAVGVTAFVGVVVRLLRDLKELRGQKEPAPQSPPISPNIQGHGYQVGHPNIIVTNIQAEAIIGQQIIQQLGTLPPSLHQLEPPPVDFTGREEELEKLCEAVETGGVTISGIQGMGGIGKTALALKLAELLSSRYPDAQIYLNLRGTDPKPLTQADALVHVIRSFHPEVKLPEGEQKLKALYRSVLHGKRALLLMDNARDAKQVEFLIPPAGSFLLITSRQHFTLPGLNELNLDTLNLNEAKNLILKIAPRVRDSAGELATDPCG